MKPFRALVRPAALGALALLVALGAELVAAADRGTLWPLARATLSRTWYMAVVLPALWAVLDRVLDATRRAPP